MYACIQQYQVYTQLNELYCPHFILFYILCIWPNSHHLQPDTTDEIGALTTGDNSRQIGGIYRHASRLNNIDSKGHGGIYGFQHFTSNVIAW